MSAFPWRLYIADALKISILKLGKLNLRDYGCENNNFPKLTQKESGPQPQGNRNPEGGGGPAHAL